MLHWRFLVLLSPFAKQLLPPLSGSVTIERVANWFPLAQLRVHVDHPDQSDQTQSCVGDCVG